MRGSRVYTYALGPCQEALPELHAKTWEIGAISQRKSPLAIHLSLDDLNIVMMIGVSKLFEQRRQSWSLRSSNFRTRPSCTTLHLRNKTESYEN